MMKDSGVDVGKCDDGGISIQGDTTINNTGLRSLGSVAVVLLAIAAGAGITALLYGRLPGPTSSATSVSLGGMEHSAPSTANWRLGIRVTDAP